MIKGIIGLEEKFTGETFSEVFRLWAKEIQRMIGSHEMSYQVLETACWMEMDSIPMPFYKALAYAREEKVLSEDGKIL